MLEVHAGELVFAQAVVLSHEVSFFLFQVLLPQLVRRKGTLGALLRHRKRTIEQAEDPQIMDKYESNPLCQLLGPIFIGELLRQLPQKFGGILHGFT